MAASADAQKAPSHLERTPAMHSSMLRTLVLTLALASPLAAFADNHPQASSPPAQQHRAAAQPNQSQPVTHAKTSKGKAHGQAHSAASPNQK
jgi:hypothetical protein